jgi:hypothetical protein
MKTVIKEGLAVGATVSPTGEGELVKGAALKLSLVDLELDGPKVPFALDDNEIDSELVSLEEATEDTLPLILREGLLGLVSLEVRESVAVALPATDEVALSLREGEIDPLNDAITESVPDSLEEVDEEMEALPLTLWEDVLELVSLGVRETETEVVPLSEEVALSLGKGETDTLPVELAVLVLV